MKCLVFLFLFSFAGWFAPLSLAHRAGYIVPGAPFRVFSGEGGELSQAQIDEAIGTVVEALSLMVAHRGQYKRFDEAMAKGGLQRVVVESRVFNSKGQEFLFLVTRTERVGKVELLVSALGLYEEGHINQPKKLVPVLAREFQWVASKMDGKTGSKGDSELGERELQEAPIETNKAIKKMSGEEREGVLLALLQNYLTTVDGSQSLEDQPFYEVGAMVPTHRPTQSGSTTQLYSLRVRKALRLIVRDPYFQEHTPRAVRSLLNGKIWNVSFVKIEERDWPARTRVSPKRVSIGKRGKVLQPGRVLLNYHRTAAPGGPIYEETDGLPMGALSPEQLAYVIAWEIEDNIVNKSMGGHVAHDAATGPQR